jgi:hypothetical protein
LIVALAACDRSGTADPADSLANRDTISIRRTREADLTGDGRPERFLVTAIGPRYDSLEVTLEIRSPEDSLLYSASWESSYYFALDDRSQIADSAVVNRVRAQVDSLLADDAFLPGGTELTTDERLNREGMRDAIRGDVAEEMWRRANNIPADSSTPATALPIIDQMERDSVSDARVESLVAELRDRPSFRYFAGGEETHVIAWSDEERRFVLIWACC